MKLKALILSVLFTTGLFSIVSVAQDRKTVLEADAVYFTDPSCSELKDDVVQSDLSKIKDIKLKEVAKDIFEGTFDATYRAQTYEAYATVESLAKNLKLNTGFSQYENITGMYLNAGENVILVGKTAGKNISLLAPYWMRKPAEGVEPTKDPNGWGLHKQELELKEGVNIVNLERAGNVYIKYFDNEPEKAPKITVHFLTGEVNGYFDSNKHSNEYWNELLDNAVSPIMDARGKHIQVAYPVEWFKEFTSGKGKELMDSYDKILNLQYSLMGLVKYNKVPKNRILARVNFNYYMFRDGDGVAYLGNKNTMRMVASPEVVVTGDPCWGFSHEVGHVLQMIPQLTWGGMMEVSNNIFSMYTTTTLGNPSRLEKQDNYTKATKSIIESNPKISYLQDEDVFNRLVPFWQLHLYFTQNGYPDFYADLMEEMRNRPDAGKRNESIKNMFEFIKLSCDITKTDLTEFFDKWGFFYTGKISLNDYGRYNFDITQKQVDDTKAYIASKKYKKPKTDITKIK